MVKARLYLSGNLSQSPAIFGVTTTSFCSLTARYSYGFIGTARTAACGRVTVLRFYSRRIHFLEALTPENRAMVVRSTPGLLATPCAAVAMLTAIISKRYRKENLNA